MGFGLVIASIFILTNMPVKSLPTKYEIETLARGYGMVYEDEVLKLFEPNRDNEKIENIMAAELPSAESRIRKIVIPKGSSSEKITDILLETGIVTDQKEFTRRIRELGVTNRLNAGEFEMPVGLSIDEVVDILMIGGRR